MSCLSELEAALQWAAGEGCHLVVDLGTLDAAASRGTLAATLQLQHGPHGERLHLCCDAGFGEREAPASVLITKHSVAASGALTQVESLAAPADAERAAAQLAAVAAAAYERQEGMVFEMAQILNVTGVPAVAHGTQHVWIKLSPFLDREDVESEVNVWRVLHETYKILLVPGHMCGVDEPGWFQCCVTGVRAYLTPLFLQGPSTQRPTS